MASKVNSVTLYFNKKVRILTFIRDSNERLTKYGGVRHVTFEQAKRAANIVTRTPGTVHLHACGWEWTRAREARS